VVIGGGAAGFFCAVNAVKMNPELEVTISPLLVRQCSFTFGAYQQSLGLVWE
jgi:succinate dehydrogenase/fumarate reductase flavoprotein subunit